MILDECRVPGILKVESDELCEQFGVDAVIPELGSKTGIALTTVQKSPINGVRHLVTSDINGWYIWCGETLEESEEFFSLLHVEHMYGYLPQVIKYLSLPPGYRFLIDKNGYEDVWYDATLLDA